MNILRYLMLALCLVCLATLVIVMCAGMSGSSLMIGGYDMGLFNFSFGSSGMTWGGEFDGETAPDGEISFACGDVKSVDLNWIGGDLEVKRHAEDVVLVVQTAKQGDIPEDRLLAYRLGTNGVLYLREGRSRRVTSNGETNVTLYLPEGFVFEGYVNLNGVSTDMNAEGISSTGRFALHTTSGDMAVSDVSAASALFESTSGDISLKDIAAADAEAASTSGGITAAGVKTGGKLTVSTTSGRLNVTDCAAGEADISTVSGELKLEGSFGSAAASTVSGKLDVSLASSPERAELSTISGRVMLRLPDAISGFSADCSTVSGGVNCEFPTVKQGKSLVYGDGASVLDISTVSGAIDIVRG